QWRRPPCRRDRHLTQIHRLFRRDPPPEVAQQSTQATHRYRRTLLPKTLAECRTIDNRRDRAVGEMCDELGRAAVLTITVQVRHALPTRHRPAIPGASKIIV